MNSSTTHALYGALQLVIDLLDAVAWPLVVLLALYLFRRPISALLDRVQKISGSGFELAAPVQQAEQRKTATYDVISPFDRGLVVERKESLRAEIAEALGDSEVPGDREDLMLTALATTSLRQQFDAFYSQIWGSQIRTLEILNLLGNAGLQKDFIRQNYYDAAAAQEPEAYANYSFEHWLGFLTGSRHVVDFGDRIAISKEGREFLKFMVDSGYSPYKPR